jgi:TPR repeat protein
LSDAAEAGIPRAILHLGACYYTGIGLGKDVVKGRALIRKAAEAGDEEAKKVLVKISE